MKAMITDLFRDHKCSCGNRWTKNQPLAFKRLEAIETRKGLDYLCKCLKCGNTFMIEFLRWGHDDGK